MEYSREECVAVLKSFLQVPLSDGTLIFEKFSAIPGAKYIEGSGTHERFVYVAGRRKDRVLLVAHADTVWDAAYDAPHGEQTLREDGAFLRGVNPEVGVGADDRAGCAMLWLLQKSGHSLLILDGEEHSKGAHKLILRAHRELLAEFNRHCYMLEPDLAGGTRYISARVPNSKRFLRTMETELGVTPLAALAQSGTDITKLCNRICGICISCGYRKFHTPTENLNVDEWYAALCRLDALLGKPQKRFPIQYGKRIKRDLKRVLSHIKDNLHKMGVVG